MTSHGLHYGIVLMDLVLHFNVFLHSDIKDKIYKFKVVKIVQSNIITKC